MFCCVVLSESASEGIALRNVERRLQYDWEKELAGGVASIGGCCRRGYCCRKRGCCSKSYCCYGEATVGRHCCGGATAGGGECEPTKQRESVHNEGDGAPNIDAGRRGCFKIEN